MNSNDENVTEKKVTVEVVGKKTGEVVNSTKSLFKGGFGKLKGQVENLKANAAVFAEAYKEGLKDSDEENVEVIEDVIEDAEVIDILQ